MASNFVSSKDSDEIRTMHTKINNVEIMMGNESNEVIEHLFESFFEKVSKSARRINEEKNYL